MPIVADAAVAIRGDLSKFPADLRKAEGSVESLGTKLNSALSPKKALAGLAVGLAGVFAASKVVDFLGDAVSAASNMNETLSKTSVILGKEALPGLEKWAEGAAEAFGQSKQQALDAASTFAIFGKSAGLAGDDLSGFSTDLTELASDLSSFYNTSPEDAIVAIGAALRGESEPIRRYGVLLDEATLRQRALKDGIIQTTSQALTPQQRVLAAQAEIFAQTSDAQGDFARTSDGLANTQRSLAAAFEDVKVEIGDALLPILLGLATWFKDEGIPMLKDFIEMLGELGEAVGGVIDWFGDVGQAWATLGMDFGDMGDKIHDIADGVGLDFDTVKDRIKALMLESGMSFADAADQAEIEFRRMVDYGVTPAMTAFQGMAEHTRPAMDEVVAVVAEGTGAIVTDFEKLPGEMADGILRGQQELADPAAQLLKFLEEVLSPAEIIARDEGFLASHELAEGLASDNVFVRQKAAEMRDAALDEIAQMGGAATSGYTIGASWTQHLAKGIGDNTYRIVNQLNYIRPMIEGFSPPKEGPLKNIDKGGFNIGKSWLDSFNLGLGGDLKLPTMPGVNGGGSLGGPMAGGASTINNTWNLNLSGVPYTFKTRDDFIKGLDAVSRFGGEGRLPSG